MVNGEGIYGTVPWKTFGEGEVNNVAGSFQDNDEKMFTSEDFRFTFKNGYLYAFCMRPSSQEFTIKSLRQSGRYDIVLGSVEALGGLTVADTKRDGEGLKITLDKIPDSDKPVCFKIEIM